MPNTSRTRGFSFVSMNKDVVRALLWGAVAFLAWNIIAVRLWPPTPRPEPAPPASAVDGSVTAPAEPPTIEGPAAPTVGDSPPDTIGAAAVSIAAGEERTLLIGDRAEGASGDLGLTLELSSVGASVRRAELSDYTLTIERDSPPYPVLAEVQDFDGMRFDSLATEKLHLREYQRDVALADVPWKVERQTPASVTFAVDLLNQQSALLRIRKTFDLPESSRLPGRYDLVVGTEVENLTDHDVTFVLTGRGPVGVRREDPRMDDRALFLGTLHAGEVQSSAAQMAGSVKAQRVVYRGAGDEPPVVWTAVANKYFVAFESFRPWGQSATPDWLAEVTEIPVGLTSSGVEAITFQTTTDPIVLHAGEKRAFTTDCYLGPKKRKAFQEVPDYVARGYDSLVLASYATGSCCSFLAFKSLTVFMINLLSLLQSVVFNYGVAIIILVLIVRTILHPVTKKGQVNMMRMQQEMGKIQPKMEELKKRFGNDKQRYNQEVMKLYQEAGVNPATQMLGCLPLFLQMPIWIALYTSLNYNIDMRHEPFVLWIRDLTAPDALIQFSGSFNFPLVGPVSSFNLLPILVSAFMFTQQKYMTKTKTPPPTTPLSDQAAQAQQMQKMMPYMTLVFGLLFYNMPSGLNLYIGASSFFGTIEQWRIRKHIEKIKDQPAGPGLFQRLLSLGQGKDPGGAPGKGPRNPSLLHRYFQRLQKAAENAEKVRSAKPKKKRT